MLPNAEQSVPQIDTGRCSGCGRCVAACPLRLITLETTGYRKHAVIINPDCCIRCKACVKACPLEAITTLHSHSFC
ncbi:MAG: 4Fe-4S dicluster domain-containing protein [Geobacter sp.]|nr:4Fe-4S dicluster domain-containing protein [Geobacter sp.]